MLIKLNLGVLLLAVMERHSFPPIRHLILTSKLLRDGLSCGQCADPRYIMLMFNPAKRMRWRHSLRVMVGRRRTRTIRKEASWWNKWKGVITGTGVDGGQKPLMIITCRTKNGGKGRNLVVARRPTRKFHWLKLVIFMRKICCRTKRNSRSWEKSQVTENLVQWIKKLKELFYLIRHVRSLK